MTHEFVQQDSDNGDYALFHSLLDAANTHLKAGRHQAAHALFRRLSEKAPEHPEVCSGMGRTLLALGEYSSARNYLTHRLNLTPKNAPTLFDLGMCHLAEKNMGEALQYFASVTSIDSSHAAAYEKHIQILLEMGDHEAAQQTFAKAWENCFLKEKDDFITHETGTDALKSLAGLSFLGGHIQLRQAAQITAKAFFIKALELYPKHTPSLMGLSAILRSQGDLEGAEKALKIAEKNEGEQIPLLISQVETCLSAGKTNEARSHLEHIRTLTGNSSEEPGNFVLSLLDVQILIASGDLQEAAEICTHLVRSFNTTDSSAAELLIYKSALAYLTEILRRLGHRQEALDMSEIVLEMPADSTTKSVMALRAGLFAECNQWEEAWPLLDKILTLTLPEEANQLLQNWKENPRPLNLLALDMERALISLPAASALSAQGYELNLYCAESYKQFFENCMVFKNVIACDLENQQVSLDTSYPTAALEDLHILMRLSYPELRKLPRPVGILKPRQISKQRDVLIWIENPDLPGLNQLCEHLPKNLTRISYLGKRLKNEPQGDISYIPIKTFDDAVNEIHRHKFIVSQGGAFAHLAALTGANLFTLTPRDFLWPWSFSPAQSPYEKHAMFLKQDLNGTWSHALEILRTSPDSPTEYSNA